MEHFHSYIFLAALALAAGSVNSIAGGGTLLTFPALLAVVSPITANATSTLALVPGMMAAAWGYRRELTPVRRWLWLLAGPSLLGGITGSLLLVRLPSRYFDSLIPWLILTAAILLLLQPVMNRFLRRQKSETEVTPAWGWLALILLFIFQFLVAVYGGYFGAGIGLLMLGAMGLIGLGDMHQMNALKTCLASFINSVSAIVFVMHGQIDWRFGPIMALAAISGGYLGARISRKLNPNFVRWLTVLIGLSLAAHFFMRR